MTEIIRSLPEGKSGEKEVKLLSLAPGEYFRFKWTSFNDAIDGKNDATFWMKVETQPKKPGRVTIVSADGKSLMERDEDHLVIKHPAKLLIEEAELI